MIELQKITKELRQKRWLDALSRDLRNGFRYCLVYFVWSQRFGGVQTKGAA